MNSPRNPHKTTMNDTMNEPIELDSIPLDAPARTHTLSSIADDLGRDKRTVQIWFSKAKAEHGELGELIYNCRYFSDDERAILVSYAAVEHPRSTRKETTPAVPEGFIQPSSAIIPVEFVETELPEGFDPGAMVKFFDGVAGRGTDTTKLLAVAKQVLTAVETVMDDKIQQQRQAIAKAEEDGAELKELISEANQNLKLKALEARLLAERQTAATTQVEKAFQELMALGKPEESAA